MSNGNSGRRLPMRSWKSASACGPQSTARSAHTGRPNAANASSTAPCVGGASQPRHALQVFLALGFELFGLQRGLFFVQSRLLRLLCFQFVLLGFELVLLEFVLFLFLQPGFVELLFLQALFFQLLFALVLFDLFESGQFFLFAQLFLLQRNVDLGRGGWRHGLR